MSRSGPADTVWVGSRKRSRRGQVGFRLIRTWCIVGIAVKATAYEEHDKLRNVYQKEDT